MKSWIAVLGLLLVACAAAWGWHALALDPGTVLVRFAGWRVETSFVFAVILAALIWVGAGLLWRLLRWPRAAWRRRARRRGRERIADGLVAMFEGRHAHASRELERAPALLARAHAAHARGDHAAADSALDAAAEQSSDAALALRAQFLLNQGRAADVVKLLQDKSTLAPSAWRSLNAAALATGAGATALTTLAPLAHDASLPPGEYDRIETDTLASALEHAPDNDRLASLWSGLTRTQRRNESVIGAYARRAAALGQPLAAMNEVEGALRRDWSESLACVYGELGPAEVNARLRQGEAWLVAQPNSAALLLTLGRLCNQAELWGKARDYLARALAIAPDATIWEAYGNACAAQGDAASAQSAYRNALRCARGEPAETLPELERSALDTRASVVEERSEHGVPRLIVPGR